jgi:hypothetical protein
LGASYGIRFPAKFLAKLEIAYRCWKIFFFFEGDAICKNENMAAVN